MGFPELRSKITSVDNPAEDIVSNVLGRCRAIVEKPLGPWVDLLARLPRSEH